MGKKKMCFLLSVCMAMGVMLSGCGDESLEQMVSMIETEQADSGNGGGSVEAEESAGNTIVQKLRGAEISNPVYHYEGSDKTKWSYIYFGSYPQSEVTEDELTEAITGASYDENGDAVVDGVKYRRALKVKTGFLEEEDDEYHYFKWESIKWRVLQNDGSTLFVMADQGLDCKRYNEWEEEEEGDAEVTWQYCTLRRWLNNDFYHTAFDSDEQDAVLGQTVINEDNTEFETEGGEDTVDSVYLLSIGEAQNTEYGFCDNGDEVSSSRWVKPSDYAHTIGVTTINYDGGLADASGNCCWWLRSSGDYPDDAAYVYDFGSIRRSGDYINFDICAVAPVLHISLSSDLWTVADESQQ